MRLRATAAQCLVGAALVSPTACSSGPVGPPDPPMTSDTPRAHAPPTRSEQYRQGAEGLVHVETLTRVATGIVVRSDGIVAVPRALLDGAGVARVVTAGGEVLPVRRVLRADDGALALVLVDADRLPALHLARAPAPAVGDDVAVVGFATGATFASLSMAVVAEPPSRLTPRRFSIRGPVPGGFSGAPVLDAHGEVVGVVERVDSAGATVLATAGLAAELPALDDADGVTLAEHAAGTREPEALEPEPIAVDDLADCSPASRDLIWNDLERGLAAADDLFGRGAPQAALLVLEGALLRHRSEVDDCRRLHDALDGALAAARRAESPDDAVRAMATAMATTLEAILSAPSHPPRTLAADARTRANRRKDNDR